jgi:NAD(P)H-dependent FMN reductase
MRFLAICGSLRAASTNLALLEAFARHAPRGSDVELFEGMATLPLFSPDLEAAGRPAAVADLARRVDEADGLIIASPEYAHGVSGSLKNALDWLVSGFEIPHKPVLLAHASMRSSFSREHLSEVLRTMSTRLFPGAFFEIHLVGKSAAEAREILDRPEAREDIRRTLADFAAFARGTGKPSRG